MARINPFRPDSPIHTGMFAGRLPQLDALEQTLLQTRSGRPRSFMVTGERGIGKTSLLRYFKYMADGSIPTGDDDTTLNFLVLEVDIDRSTTEIGLIRKIELGLRRGLAKTDKARSILKTGWEFLSRIEGFGFKIQGGAEDISETLDDEFAYSLATTTNRITQDDAPLIFGKRYDGVVLVIDEADNGPPSLQLGSHLKLLTERIQRYDCSRFMIGLAGLPGLRDTLRASHESSLRIFDELHLDRLTDDEAGRVIDRALEEANKENKQEQTSIDPGGRSAIIQYSEGYPHFIQQFGFCAFAADTDGVIDSGDAAVGAFGPGGALETIGERYYRNDFYNKIQKDSYRQVLRIMAENGNQWVSKKEISNNFKGKDTTLNNAISALRDRKIILSREGSRGVYRLQHRGFATWIKLERWKSRRSSP